jgi:Condensation domain
MGEVPPARPDQADGPAAALLARLVERRKTAGAAGLRPADRAALPSYPLSAGQQELWFLQQLAPEETMYNCPAAWCLDGPVDEAVLTAAIGQLTARHEVLRTRFAERDGQPVQVIDPPGPARLTVTPVPRGADLAARIREYADRPFDLARGPLLRPVLFRQPGTGSVLLLSMHHIVFDQWSEDVLWRDLSASYRRLAGGDEKPPPPLPVQYLDFAVSQRELLTGPAAAGLRGYWQRQLTGAPLLGLPADRPRPGHQTFRGDTCYFPIPPESTAGVRLLARRERTTDFVCYLAAFTTVLARWCGQRDVVLGTLALGRDRPQLADLIGFFVNTLVLRIDVGGEPTFRTVLARADRTMTGALAHQAMPFPALVELLRPLRDPARSPLFPVLFTHSAAAARPPRSGLPDITVSRLATDLPVARFELVLNVDETARGVHGALEYNTDLFHRSTIERLAERFLARLARTAADPDHRVYAPEPAPKG